MMGLDGGFPPKATATMPSLTSVLGEMIVESSLVVRRRTNYSLIVLNPTARRLVSTSSCKVTKTFCTSASSLSIRELRAKLLFVKVTMASAMTTLNSATSTLVARSS